MSQQINLYNPQLRRAREYFSLRVLLIGLTGVLVLAAFGYAWYGYQISVRVKQMREQDAKLQTLRDETVALSKRIGERGKNAELEKRLQLIEAQYARLEKMRASLDQLATEGATGFSEYMRAFARQSMQDVWLTGFSIGSTGAEMRIEGRTLNPDLVPAYISRLNGEPLLQGRKFAQFSVRQSSGEGARPAAAATPVQGQSAPPLAFHEFGLVSSAAAEMTARGVAR